PRNGVGLNELLGHKPGLFDWKSLHDMNLLLQMIGGEQKWNGGMQPVSEALTMRPQVLRSASRQVQHDVKRRLIGHGLSAEATLAFSKDAHTRQSCSCGLTPELSRA